MTGGDPKTDHASSGIDALSGIAATYSPCRQGGLASQTANADTASPGLIPVSSVGLSDDSHSNVRHDTGPLCTCRFPLSRCTSQVCSYQRSESRQAVLFPVVLDRGAHRPSPYGMGGPTTVLETHECLPDTSPAGGRCKMCAWSFQPGDDYSWTVLTDVISACLFHHENRRCRVTRLLDFSG